MKRLMIEKAKLKLLINSIYGNGVSDNRNKTALNDKYITIARNMARIRKRITKIKRILDAR
jgi:hypothetical protein